MFQAGAATRIITNKIGRRIQAATHEQDAKSIRDDLEANVLYLADSNERVMLINCDCAVVRGDVVAKIRAAVVAATGMPERNIIVSATHTHAGPTVLPTNPFSMPDDEWAGRLEGWLADAAKEAVANARPCRIGYAQGVARIGYNRRACWADGTHTMYGNTKRPDFTGIEGPQDPTHVVMFAEDEKGKIVGLVHNNSCHPVNFYGADFFSADFPGTARKLIRDAIGNMPVLYLNGGIGDNSPTDLLQPDRLMHGEPVMKRQSYIVAGETLRLMNEAARHADPVLRHAWTDLEVPVRLPDASKIAKDRELLARAMKDKTGINRMELTMAFGRISLMDQYSDRPVDRLAIHAVRVGGLMLATNPCELYGQFMIDVRRRSPAEATMFADLSDGFGGYCPTIPGQLGGGYSGEPIYWTRLSSDAGYRIVETAATLLHQLWRA